MMRFHTWTRASLQIWWHIFNECAVSIGLQYSLGQHFDTVKKFSTYADSRERCGRHCATTWVLR